MIPDRGFEILIRKEERLKIKKPSIQAKLEKEQNKDRDEEIDIKANIKEIKNKLIVKDQQSQSWFLEKDKPGKIRQKNQTKTKQRDIIRMKEELQPQML